MSIQNSPTRILKYIIALAFSANACSEDFAVQQLPPYQAVRSNSSHWVDLANGQFTSIEQDGLRGRVVTYSDDGKLVSARQHSGWLEPLGSAGNGDILGVDCQTKEMTRRAASGQLLWRIPNPIGSYSCIDIPFLAVADRDGNVFTQRTRHAPLTLVRPDAESVQLDLWSVVEPGFVAGAMFGSPTRSGIIVTSAAIWTGAFSDPEDAHQFAAINARGQLDWLYTSPNVSRTQVEWVLHHGKDVRVNASGQAALLDFVFQDYDSGFMGGRRYEALRANVAVLDVAGALRWRTELVPEIDEREPRLHLFDDGAAALLTGVQEDYDLPTRLRLIGGTGQLLTDQMRNGARDCAFAAPRGEHWVICAYADKTIATSLDTGSDVQLGNAPYARIINRNDGKALVFLANAATRDALLFDGSAGVQAQSIASSPPWSDNSAAPVARRRLPEGDELVLTAKSLQRIGADLAVQWTRPLAEATRMGLAAGVESQLMLTGDNACAIYADSSRRLECFATRTGETTMSVAIPGELNRSVRVFVRSDGFDLLWRDLSRHVHHWSVTAQGSVSKQRDLGLGVEAWIDGSGAIARGIEGAPTLVRSDLDAPAAVATPLALNAPLGTDSISARIDGTDLVTIGYALADGIGVGVVRRFDAALNQTWAREFALVTSMPRLLALDNGELRLVVTRGHTRELHLLDANSGATLEPVSTAPDQGLLVQGPGRALGIATASNGTIEWRAWDAAGTSLAPRAWRCPQSCVLHDASLESGRLQLTAAADDPYRLTLDHPFTARSAPLPDDGAIAGVFTAANETNRGYVIDWLPSSRTLFVARFAGDTSANTLRKLLDWETMQGTVTAGADEIVLTRYQSANGRFASADDAATTAFGSATLIFDGCDRAELILAQNGAATSERVHLTRSGPRLTTCHLRDGSSIPAQAESTARGGFDARQSGAWVASGANDQGILAAVLPATSDSNGVFFAPWFSYWPNAGDNSGTSNRHWLTLQGDLTPSTNGSVDLTIYRATAGSYGAIRPSNTYRVGSATWTLHDCERATLSYHFDVDESAQPYSGRSGVLNYARPGACTGGP